MRDFDVSTTDAPGTDDPEYQTLSPAPNNVLPSASHSTHGSDKLEFRTKGGMVFVLAIEKRIRLWVMGYGFITHNRAKEKGCE